jgi:hypothetical protein
LIKEIGFESKLITYLESAPKHQSIYVVLKVFRQHFFPQKFSPRRPGVVSFRQSSFSPTGEYQLAFRQLANIVLTFANWRIYYGETKSLLSNFPTTFANWRI